VIKSKNFPEYKNGDKIKSFLFFNIYFLEL